MFWHTIPNDDLKLYEISTSHIGDFIEDKLVDELIIINRTLGNRNPFTKIRNQNKKKKLEERKKQIEAEVVRSMREGMACGIELSSFIDNLNEMINRFKDSCRKMPEIVLDKKYPDMIGNFVCDIYDAVGIDRDYSDTEYFWPVAELYKFSNDPKFENLFGKYRSYIAQMYRAYGK